MKIPLLPDTDLARIAPLPTERKEVELEIFRITHPPYRYVPFRKSLGDTLNAQQGFLPPLARVPFERIAEGIRAESRKPDELEANIAVARPLYDYAIAERIEARTHDMSPLILAGVRLMFWHSLVLIDDGKVTVPFFDPRRSTTKLTSLARQFVFSVMNERLRVLDPDFADVKLIIYQFTTPERGPRAPKPHLEGAAALFGFAELEHMVRETYDIWNDVYTRRTERERKRGGGL